MSDDAFDVLEALAKQLNFDVDALPDDATKAAGFIRCRADRRTLLFLYPDGWDFSRGRKSKPLACIGAVDPNEMPSPTTEWGCSVSIPGGDPENDAQRGIFDTMREAMDTAERWAKELRAEAEAVATLAATEPAPVSPTVANACADPVAIPVTIDADAFESMNDVFSRQQLTLGDVLAPDAECYVTEYEFRTALNDRLLSAIEERLMDPDNRVALKLRPDGWTLDGDTVAEPNAEDEPIAIVVYALEPSPETGHEGWVWWSLGKMGESSSLVSAMDAVVSALRAKGHTVTSTCINAATRKDVTP